jgi:hypothetical protein
VLIDKILLSKPLSDADMKIMGIFSSEQDNNLALPVRFGEESRL